MKFKSAISLLLALAMVFVFASCGEKASTTAAEKESSAAAAATETTESSASEQQEASQPSDTVRPAGPSSFKQFEAPQNGEEIVVMTTSMGVIKMRLFPEDAPKAVENFKGLISKGYYDGIIFHRVINEFMIQGGDPEGTGRGGESFFGENFDIELSDNLYNFRGALCMANTGMPKSNGSQFFIVQSHNAGADVFDRLQGYGYPIEFYPQSVIDKYAEVGGYPSLDANIYPEGMMVGYTVFGQVFEGMDVVDAIAAVQTDEADKPLEDVVIEKVELAKYEG
ncbi:MAG: peptidylprolyl isomerase [Clostridia bacterium]|nr:peptidylprolyl isomerase [Clostridia bacterium]